MARRYEAQRWLRDAAGFVGSECLNWPFALTAKGYGAARFNGAGMNAHRAVCLLAHGEPPTAAHIEVAHSCGNRKCCNPAHLRHATSAENSADALAHGTFLVGERAPRAKLREADVRQIRASSESHASLGRRFGVSGGAIHLIRSGENWAHLGDDMPRNTDA